MIFPDLLVEFTGGNKIQPVDFRPEIENTAGAPGLDHVTKDLGWWQLAEIEPMENCVHGSTARRRTSRKQSFSNPMTRVIWFGFELLWRALRLALWLWAALRCIWRQSLSRTKLYVWCDKVRGKVGHACAHGPVPHNIKARMLRGDNSRPASGHQGLRGLSKCGSLPGPGQSRLYLSGCRLGIKGPSTEVSRLAGETGAAESLGPLLAGEPRFNYFDRLDI